MPTTEQLLDLEKEIQRLIEKKRRTDLHIIDLEARIHAVEGDYFRETALFGSLVNGLEGYLATNSSSVPQGRRNTTREIKDTDRLFSQTSSSHPRVRKSFFFKFHQALAVHSRLVRERTLANINLGTRKSTGTIGNAASGGGSGTRRRRPADPTWSTPTQKASRSR